ncbi:MAG TPA: hypothetical protein VNN73_17155 [Blastocatellia bacterium]|nr:hypothetical protein [Blastocatellia bacterium]
MRYALPQSSTAHSSQERQILSAGQSDAMKAGYSTDPIAFPGSVTEQTTRQLDESVYQPPLENNSKETK